MIGNNGRPMVWKVVQRQISDLPLERPLQTEAWDAAGQQRFRSNKKTFNILRYIKLY